MIKKRYFSIWLLLFLSFSILSEEYVCSYINDVPKGLSKKPLIYERTADGFKGIKPYHEDKYKILRESKDIIVLDDTNWTSNVMMITVIYKTKLKAEQYLFIFDITNQLPPESALQLDCIKR